MDSRSNQPRKGGGLGGAPGPLVYRPKLEPKRTTTPQHVRQPAAGSGDDAPRSLSGRGGWVFVASGPIADVQRDAQPTERRPTGAACCFSLRFFSSNQSGFFYDTRITLFLKRHQIPRAQTMAFLFFVEGRKKSRTKTAVSLGWRVPFLAAWHAWWPLERSQRIHQACWSGWTELWT